MADPFADVLYLETLVPVMRRLGVLEHATTKLGPPQSEAGTDTTEAIQRIRSPIDQEQQSRERQRRVLTSGGPRPALVKP